MATIVSGRFAQQGATQHAREALVGGDWVDFDPLSPVRHIAPH
jgi:hypothetical protein